MKPVALALALLAVAFGARAADELPVFDAHLHYNDVAVARYPVAEVLALFRQNNVRGILANSRPNDGTHLLVEAGAASDGALWVVPFLRPYRTRDDMGSWFRNPEILAFIDADLKQRASYRGIGEFHLHGEDAAHPQVREIVALAKAKGLFLHAHSDERAVETLYAHDPAAKVIWAHTGFSTAPETVERMLRAHPTLVCELSYRSGIVDGAGQLTPEWRRLFDVFADRFVLGSDTWINERWDAYSGLIGGYRKWLAQLPAETARKIAFGNAERLFAQ
jgi:predicted TIM-barrel fold metal-dependent hydrolase